MKEHPIIFSGEMVRAILDGKKTQTRRVIKPQPRSLINGWPTIPDKSKKPFSVNALTVTTGGAGIGYGNRSTKVYPSKMMSCPYGVPNDHLWIREPWATIKEYDHLKPSDIPRGDAGWPFVYYAAYPKSAAWNSKHRGRVHPSIHMPRWASRITLEVTGVRVERVQDISNEDALAEGIKGWVPDPRWTLHGHVPDDLLDYRNPFAKLWDSINAKRGYPWQSNPWVWVVEFRQI